MVDAAPPANALLSATLHTFAWAGLNTSGQRVHGELQARDAHEALLQLRRQGITHTTVRTRRTSAWRHRRRQRAVATFTPPSSPPCCAPVCPCCAALR